MIYKLKLKIATWALNVFFEPFEIFLLKRACEARATQLKTPSFIREHSYPGMTDDVLKYQSLNDRLDTLLSIDRKKVKLQKRSNTMRVSKDATIQQL